MGSLIKWLFGLILLVVVVIVAAVVILPMVIDPNDYKPQIVATAKEKLGRDVAIEQDLGLSVFPWLGIETGGVRIGNADGFKAASFAEIEKLGLKVKLLPLLSRKIEVDTLVLKGLRLNLEKDAKGRTNWDDLAGAGGKDTGETKATEAGGEAGAPLALSVQGIQIEDANVTWDDRQAGQHYELDGVRLVTGALSPGATVPVDGSVNCSVSANDDVLIGRMAAPLDGVRRVDAALRMSPSEDETWVHDVPFDPATGEVVFAPALAQVRQLPSHDLEVRLLAVAANGSKDIGRYVFHHSR